LASALACAQVRIVPWLVVPVALVVAAMAVMAARFFGVAQGSSAAVSGFSALILLGVVVTIVMALSTAESDAVSLSTPLGPQVVVLGRLAVVLAVDAVAALAASGIVATWGTAGNLATLVAGWLVPLALVAGLVTFLAIWTAPWAGVVVGLAVVPFVVPRSEAAMDVGLGALMGAVSEAITPLGIVVLGVAVLAVAIGSARRAAAAAGAAVG